MRFEFESRPGNGPFGFCFLNFHISTMRMLGY
jgi:hypothetical protein